MMKGYIFDTNIFNNILDQKIDIKKLLNINCFITHIQHDEIQATNEKTRRAHLTKVFSLIPQKEISTSSAIFGVSRYGKAKYSDGELFNKMLVSLNKKNKNKPNNRKDILIAETAIANHLTLVTHDIDLFSVMTKSGGASCNLFHLLNND